MGLFPRSAMCHKDQEHDAQPSCQADDMPQGVKTFLEGTVMRIPFQDQISHSTNMDRCAQCALEVKKPQGKNSVLMV